MNWDSKAWEREIRKNFKKGFLRLTLCELWSEVLRVENLYIRKEYTDNIYTYRETQRETFGEWVCVCEREGEMVGSGGADRSKEAVGMMALHEALRSVCLNSDWTYSVFWTIRPRPYFLWETITFYLYTSLPLASYLSSFLTWVFLFLVHICIFCSCFAEESEVVMVARLETIMGACEYAYLFVYLLFSLLSSVWLLRKLRKMGKETGIYSYKLQFFWFLTI